MLAALTAWVALWWIYERLPYEERLPTVWLLQLLPFVIGAQVALDVMVPFVGDIVIVVGVASAVNETLRRRMLPPARVICSRAAAARVASAYGGARRAS